MIPPTRCFTCGQLLPLLYWKRFDNALENKSAVIENDKKSKILPIGKNMNNFEFNSVSNELNAMGVRRYCCRRMYLSHCEIIQKL